jgi:hypothetical protein
MTNVAKLDGNQKSHEPVIIHVDPELSGTTLLCQSSLKRSGKVSVLKFNGFLPTDKVIQIVITEMKPIESFADSFPLSKGYIVGESEHTDNTTDKVGVVRMGPFRVTLKEFYNGVTFAAPLKVSGGATFGIFAYFFKLSVFNMIFLFTAVAIFDWAISMIPGIHDKEKNSRSDVSLSKFFQWSAALLLAGGALTVQTTALESDATGYGAEFARGLFGFATGILLLIYGSRMFWSVIRLFYGKRANSVWNGMISVFPEKLQKALKDFRS